MAGQCATRHPEHELGDGSDVPLPKFQAFVASGWAAAAEECKFNPDEGTIRYRNKLDRMYFLLAQKVADQHLPVEYLVICARLGLGRSARPVDAGLLNPGPQDGGDGPKTQAGVRVLPDRRGSAGQRRLE